jgi:exoribonuclease-2
MSILEDFPSELEELSWVVSNNASQPQPGDELREDLTHLKCFAIDDSTTMEVDDALSIEQDQNGNLTIWIHVADPNRLINRNTALDIEAERRALSTYLSHQRILMFPHQLAAGPLSLIPGKANAAISINVLLKIDGSIDKFSIHRSWIQITYAICYADADELIELSPPEEPELGKLNDLLNTRRNWRKSHGALISDQAEGRFSRENGNIKLKITEQIGARAMVSEAMVLAGAAIAEYGIEHQLALPYRAQEGNQTLTREQLLALPSGPVRWAHQRLGLGRSRLQTLPAAHHALGLNAYVQCTSPIRRYNDLLAQRQLLQHMGLIADPPLSEAELKPLLDHIDIRVRESAQIYREDQRKCLLEWLIQEQHNWLPLDGIFLRWLRMDIDLALVWIESWCLELPARLRERADPGDPLTISIELVDPSRDLLHLKAISD